MERRYGYGVGLVITGGLFLSTSGILLRNIESASGWQILFYRGIAIVCVSVVVYCIVGIRAERQLLRFSRTRPDPPV